MVRMVVAEPDFGKTLSWLHSGNEDDRLLASALEFHRAAPPSTVVPLTDDINLQSKAVSSSVP